VTGGTWVESGQTVLAVKVTADPAADYSSHVNFRPPLLVGQQPRLIDLRLVGSKSSHDDMMRNAQRVSLTRNFRELLSPMRKTGATGVTKLDICPYKCKYSSFSHYYHKTARAKSARKLRAAEQTWSAARASRIQTSETRDPSTLQASSVEAWQPLALL